MVGYDPGELEPERYPAYWPGLILIAFVGFVIHALVATRYGYFRDELYYLACADHLAWGYVDHPPLSIFVLKVFTSIFGDNLFGVRLPGFLAGVGITFLFGSIARESGADENGQLLSAVFGAFTPVIMVVTHLYSMNGLDILLSAWVVLYWLRARSSERRLYWVALGPILGLALLNKLSVLLLLGGIGLAMLLTPRRRELLTWHPWTGLLIALLVASPYALWLSQNDFITFEFIRNATQNKMLPVPPLQFLLTQVVVVSPFLFFIAVIGFFGSLYKSRYRPQFIAFAVVLTVLLISQKTRENYLAPAYALIVPAGAMMLSSWFSERPVLKWIYRVGLIGSCAFFLAVALPVLPPKTFISIMGSTTEKLPATERGKKSPLQGHADMFGWPEMAQAAREVWLTLPEEERATAPVLGLNYGESSAVWFFNKDKNGPPVIGFHNNWWLWGPEPWDGKTLIIIGETSPEFQSLFTTYETVRRLNEPYAVPEEATAPISIARGFNGKVPELWAESRHIQ